MYYVTHINTYPYRQHADQVNIQNFNIVEEQVCISHIMITTEYVDKFS